MVSLSNVRHVYKCTIWVIFYLPLYLFLFCGLRIPLLPLTLSLWFFALHIRYEIKVDSFAVTNRNLVIRFNANDVRTTCRLTDILCIALCVFCVWNICSCQKFIPHSLFPYSHWVYASAVFSFLLSTGMCFTFFFPYFSTWDDFSTSCQSFVSSRKEKAKLLHKSTVVVLWNCRNRSRSQRSFVYCVHFTEQPVSIHFWKATNSQFKEFKLF